MRYINESDFRHDAPQRAGVLIANLGSPDAPTAAALRRYLGEFLWDPRVVEMPRPLWWLILHGVILRIRPKRSAAAYQSVWTEEGAPLLANSRRQLEALRHQLHQRYGEQVVVELGMRYGNPSIADALERLRRQNVRRLLVLPLYPQYSATTTASIDDAVFETLRRWRWVPELRTINQYHDAPGYLDALAGHIRRYWEQHGRGERLLFSFHGIPKRYLLNGDPYHCQCQKTARLLAERLELGADQWQLTFQSRFGREEWLKPYTDHTLQALAGEGVARVDVVCPGFSADCLETLEEINDQNRELFLHHGGKEFHYIPALNDEPGHIQFLGELVGDHASWLAGPAEEVEERVRRKERAAALGATG